MHGVSSLLSTLQGKILAGVVATSIVAGGGALAVTGANFLSDPDREASSSVASEVEARRSGTSASSSQSASTDGSESGADASTQARAGRAGVSGSAGVGVGPGVAVLGHGAGGVGPATGGGRGGAGGSAGGGSTGPGGTGGPGAPAISVPERPNLGGETPPSTGSLPSEIAVHRSGSHSVVVPATEGDAQQLCLKGLVNRCRTIRVPATKGVTVTFSYDGNASATVPSFTVNPCERGVEIGVLGLTPGATVKAEAEGVTLTAEVTGGEEIGQSASFCKA